MIFDISDIYQYSSNNNLPMLSNYAGDFWTEYNENYATFDKLFKKKFRSWFPMDQGEKDLDEIAEEFADDVEALLTVNAKKYSELYRLHIIPDNDKYSLTDNVYESEQINRVSETSGTFTKGSQTDVTGQQTITEDKEHITGSQDFDSEVTFTPGTARKTTENSTSAFNESGYTATDRSVEVDETRTDTTITDNITGGRTDSDDNTITHSARTDTSGQRSDTSGEDVEETTTRLRSGNIGVKTVDQILEDHKDFWLDFSFYDIIFNDIARELLRGWS